MRKTAGFAPNHSVQGFARYHAALGFAPILIVVVIAVVAVIGLVFVQNRDEDEDDDRYSNSLLQSGDFQRNEDGLTDESIPLEGCVSNPNPVFSAHITDLSKIKFINPPGNIDQDEREPKKLGTVTHAFLVATSKVPVYAPTDSVLAHGAYYVEEDMNQYALLFEVSCDVYYIFDHILEAEDKIREVFPETPENDIFYKPTLKQVEFKAGELIGYTTGTRNARTWDIGVHNRSKTNYLSGETQFKVTTRDLFADCPFDYFPPEMRAEYYSLFGSTNEIDPYPTTFCKN